MGSLEHSDRTVSVRGRALDSLLDIFEKNLFCDKVMQHTLLENEWDKRDKNLYRRLVTGTVERLLTLDYILEQFSKIRVKKMKPVIRNILRMSLYQILYMEKIPDSAVCNEAVKLVEKRKLYPLKGFVNGVLRNILRNRENISFPPTEEKLSSLSIRYSMPEWIIKRWFVQFGEEVTEGILKEFLKEKRGTVIRICGAGEEGMRRECLDMLEKEGVRMEKGVFFPYAYRIHDFSGVESLMSFQEGKFFVQDESSMLPAELSGVKKGDFVLDLCAAPGSKAMHIADLLEGTGKVLACDLTEEKKALLEENRKRLGLKNVRIMINDARKFREEWEECADILIADLPCSGLGVIGKKCDIKYKTKEGDIFALAELQKEILKTAVKYVKKGGRLIFSTCTIAKEENEENVFWIEENLPVKRISIENKLPALLKGKTGEQGYIQVMPEETGSDGFFVAVFEKQ